ncbi:hypothetical protein HID58_055499, partial [Brassica napus]
AEEILHIFLQNLSTPTTWGQEMTYSHQTQDLRSCRTPLQGRITPYKQYLVHASSRSKPRIAPQQYFVPAGSRFQPWITPLRSLVPAGSRFQPKIRSLPSLVPAGPGSQLQSMPLQTLDSIFSTGGIHHQHQYQWIIH